MNDIEIAKAYIRKAQSSKARGIEFALSFTAFKNLMRAQRCFYTGVRMTAPNNTPVPTARTIDRKDRTKGYVSGNVVACCSAANQVKSYWENPRSLFGPDFVVKVAQKCVTMQTEKK